MRSKSGFMNLSDYDPSCILDLDPANYSAVGRPLVLPDASGNINNGVLNGGVGYSALNGGILQIDGLDDYINTTVNFGGSNKYTISLWINNVLRTASDGQILRLGSATVEKLLLYTSKTSGYKFGIYSATISTGISPTVITENTWYNIAFVYDTTSVTLYVNGASVYTYSTVSTTLGVETVQIGRRQKYPTYQFNAKIGQTKIYNRALSATEILAQFNASKARYGL